MGGPVSVESSSLWSPKVPHLRPCSRLLPTALRQHLKDPETQPLLQKTPDFLLPKAYDRSKAIKRSAKLAEHNTQQTKESPRGNPVFEISTYGLSIDVVPDSVKQTESESSKEDYLNSPHLFPVLPKLNNEVDSCGTSSSSGKRIIFQVPDDRLEPASANSSPDELSAFEEEISCEYDFKQVKELKNTSAYEGQENMGVNISLSSGSPKTVAPVHCDRSLDGDSSGSDLEDNKKAGKSGRTERKRSWASRQVGNDRDYSQTYI